MASAPVSRVGQIEWLLDYYRDATNNHLLRAQIPTAPQKQEDLYDSGSSGTSTGEAGSEATQKPNSSDPSPSR